MLCFRRLTNSSIGQSWSFISSLLWENSVPYLTPFSTTGENSILTIEVLSWTERLGFCQCAWRDGLRIGSIVVQSLREKLCQCTGKSKWLVLYVLYKNPGLLSLPNARRSFFFPRFLWNFNKINWISEKFWRFELFFMILISIQGCSIWKLVEIHNRPVTS